MAVTGGASCSAYDCALIWGSADQTFPLSIGRALQRKAPQLGGLVTLDIYEGRGARLFLEVGNRVTLAQLTGVPPRF